MCKLRSGNALVIVLVMVIILVPIGFIMMDRLRALNYESRRIYNSFVLEQAARAGIESILNQVRQGDFSTGPHESNISEGIRYRTYIDTSGIGLIGQKICNVFSRAEGDGGQSLLSMVTVEVYPNSQGNMIIPHSYYILDRDLFIDTFNARQALLNYKNMQHDVLINQLRLEAKMELKNYQTNLEKILPEVPENIRKKWNSLIVPELLRRKVGK